MGLTAVNTNYKERLGAVMKLKVGDIVEFKKYEDMNDDEIFYIGRDFFPKSGKIKEIKNDGFFFIEGYGYLFDPKSVTRIISDVDDVDINSLNPYLFTWVKATVNICYDDTVFINPVEHFVDKDNLKKVKHETLERFIVQEHEHGMYIGKALDLVSNKKAAQVYAGSDAAYQEATDMHLNEYNVIPYDD